MEFRPDGATVMEEIAASNPQPQWKNMKNRRGKMQQQTDIAGGGISTSISSIIVRQGTSV
jgi:hypothetical protein